MERCPVCYLCKRAENRTLNVRGMESVELRPYGPNNQPICFDCAMKDEPALKRRYEERMRRAENEGEGVVVVSNGPLRAATYKEKRMVKRALRGSGKGG
jgi:hypothetical protein